VKDKYFFCYWRKSISIEISSLAKGIYIVILQNKDAVLQSKIVVQQLI
jgi:hypothetical protein